MNPTKVPNLTQTRTELLNYLAQQITPPKRAEPEAAERRSPRDAAASELPADARAFDWSALFEAGLASWWHDHPARAGASLLRSATTEYARKKPMQVVTIAAVAGAAVVFLKPWRVVSVSALALSLFRSSNFTGVATSMLETAAQSMQKEKL